MKRITVGRENITSLQASLNTQLTTLIERGVSLSGQAHSDNCATVIISVSGTRAVIQRTMVLVKTYKNEDVDGKQYPVWHCYMNGEGYELSSLSEFKSLIKIQTIRMKGLSLMK